MAMRYLWKMVSPEEANKLSSSRCSEIAFINTLHLFQSLITLEKLHDVLKSEEEQVKTIVKQEMENAIQLSVPLDVDRA